LDEPPSWNGLESLRENSFRTPKIGASTDGIIGSGSVYAQENQVD